jgi:V-type H+-transporting ATPase subunit D
MMMNISLKNAERGYSLSQRKNDALKMRYRMIINKVVECKMKFAENWNNWQFSLTEAKYASGPEISQIVLQNVDEAMIHVFSKKENVAGVILPGFELYKVQGDPNHLIGLVCISSFAK